MSFRILFVCTGNICRSPLAEAVFRHKVSLCGLSDRVIIDSAGTHGYHIGERPDPRTLRIAAMNHIPTEGIRARQIKNTDFEEFDLILGMDRGHVRLLKDRADPVYHGKIRLFMEAAGQDNIDVPDPYYGDFSEFEAIFHQINAATEIIKNLI